jgi:F-type H+-transporting ATPase subunit b
MRRSLILLIAIAVALFAFPLFAQTHSQAPEHPSDASNNVAHGSEKAAHEVAHPTEGHGEGHAAPKTYFGIPGWILKLINMIVFIGLLVYLLKGPLGVAFSERRNAIRAQLQEATERRQKADRLAADIQARLDQIEGEVAAILQRAREEGERQKGELIAAAEVESQKILAAARNEVDVRLKAARQELTTYARHLATERAGQLLEQSVTEADRKRLFDESVASIAEVRS